MRRLRPVLTSEPVVRSDPASGGHEGLFLLLARSSFLPLFFSTEASTAKSGAAMRNRQQTKLRTRKTGKFTAEAYARQTSPYVRTCRSSNRLARNASADSGPFQKASELVLVRVHGSKKQTFYLTLLRRLLFFPFPFEPTVRSSQVRFTLKLSEKSNFQHLTTKLDNRSHLTVETRQI